MHFWRRFWGLIIILRTLLPVLIIVAFVLIGRQTVRDLRFAVAPHVAQIDASVASIQHTLNDTRQTVATLDARIDKVSLAAQGIQAALTVDMGSVTQAVGVRPFHLADRLFSLLGLEVKPTLETTQQKLNQTVDVLGLTQVKSVFGDLTGVLQDLADVAGVTQVSREVETIIDEGRAAWRQSVQVVLGTATKALVLGIVTLVLIVLAYLESFFRNLSRGWAMLRGRRDPWRVY